MDTSSKKETYKAIQYKVSAHLENEHSGSATITSVAFSPEVSYLACAGDDGKISIWETRTGKLLHVFFGKISMLSVTWINSKQVVSGMRNGMIFIGTVDEVALELRALTFLGHQHAISCISAQEDGAHCATGAGDEVKIWKPREGIAWDESQYIVLPTRSGTEVRVSDLCWGRRQCQLFVAYLSHGVILWDTNNGNILHRLENIRTQCISLPPPESTTPDLLAVSNATSGFDLYDCDQMYLAMEPFTTFQDQGAQQDNSVAPLPVLQIHGGNVIIGGSPNGRVCLWDIKSPTHKAIQVLRHIDSSPITGLAFAYDLHRDDFFIATVTKRQDNAPIVYVWRSQDKEKSIKGAYRSAAMRHQTPHWIRNGCEWVIWGFAGVLVGLMSLVITGFIQNKRRV